MREIKMVAGAEPAAAHRSALAIQSVSEEFRHALGQIGAEQPGARYRWGTSR